MGQFLFTFQIHYAEILTYYAEEAENLSIVSIALGAMYMISSVIEIYGVVGVSMVGYHIFPTQYQRPPISSSNG